jgi:hypothetical protein
MLPWLLLVLLPLVVLLPLPAPIVIPTAALAAEGQAGSADPLTEGVGARERALGTGVALARGPAALGWNPALLAGGERLALHAHLSPLPSSGSYEHVGVAVPWGPGMLGAGLTRLGTGDIQIFDASSVAAGTASFADGEVGVGYGLALPHELSAGLLWRYRWQSLGDARGSGMGLDLGVAASPARVAGLELGLRYRGVVTPSLTLATHADRLPRSLDLGASYTRTLGGHPVCWNGATLIGDGLPAVVLGAEVQVARQLWARGALRGTEPRFGVGVAAGVFVLDYLLESRDLGLVHGFSITAHFGRGAADRREALTRSAREEGAVAERALHEQEVDGFRAAAREREEAGDLAGAERLWQTYATHRPQDAEAEEALARLAAQETAEERDQLRTAKESARVSLELEALRRAVDDGDLMAATTLASRLSAEARATAAAAALATRLAGLGEARVAELRRQARREQAAGHEMAAAAAWSRLLLLDPDDHEAIAAIRDTERRIDGLEDSQRAQRGELDRLTLLIDAYQAYSAEEYVLAETLADSLLSVDPGSDDAGELKRRLERRTSPPAARVTDQSRIHYIEGMRHFNAGRYADAITAWERILALDPDNDSVRRNIDEARARLGIERRSE